jgi:hypothetical protein
VRVVENGIEVGALAAEVARLRAGRKDRLVHLGVLGSVIPSKGVLELARAVQRAAVPGLVLEHPRQFAELPRGYFLRGGVARAGRQRGARPGARAVCAR